MCAFFISTLFTSDFPLWRLREKFGVKLAEICRPDPMSLQKHVAGDQFLQLQFIDCSRRQQLPAPAEIAIARAQDIQPRTHQVDRRSIREDVQKPGP